MPTVEKQSAKGVKAKTKVSFKQLTNEATKMKILLYGQSGSGKTSFWSTFPGRLAVIICSGGNNTNETLSLSKDDKKRVYAASVEHAEELKTLIEQVGNDHMFDTVILDHVSGLQDIVLKDILGLDEIPVQKGWGLASQQQYGQCTQQCKEYLRALLNLDKNVVIIGQERTFGGSDESLSSDLVTPTVGVATVPSLAGWLYPACDYVVQAFKRPRMITSEKKIGNKTITTERRGKGIDYCLRCEPHDVFTTKFRVPKGHYLPGSIVNPNYVKLRSVIEGTYKESEPPKK